MQAIPGLHVQHTIDLVAATDGPESCKGAGSTVLVWPALGSVRVGPQFFLSLPLTVVMKIMTKSNWGRKGFIILDGHSPSSREVRSSEQEPGGRGGALLIGLLPLLTQPIFLYHPVPSAQGWDCPLCTETSHSN